MSVNLKIELSKDKDRKEDYLRVQVKGKSKKVSGKLTLFRYRDKDTRQIVYVVPTLDISSYGATTQKANEMLKFSVNDFCRYITDLSPKKIEAELIRLGWKHNQLKKKEYSKIFVDEGGELKNFNAVGDSVEICELAM